MYLDIDEKKMKNFNFLLLLKMFKGVQYRKTRHGYHFYVPIDCNTDNFIYCLVLRKELGDDPGRIEHDIKRLDLECFYQNFDVVFNLKIQSKKIYRTSPWIKM